MSGGPDFKPPAPATGSGEELATTITSIGTVSASPPVMSAPVACSSNKSTSQVPQVALINGMPVPCRMTTLQMNVLLPGGILGLRDANDVPVFPSDDGTIQLDAGKRYTLPSSAAATPSSGDNQQPLSLSLQRNNNANNANIVMTSDPSGDDIILIPQCLTPNASPGTATEYLRRGKLILDRVHEHVMMSPVCVELIDTPEFQRLRGLKQLGATQYLYPGATHTRFEHSIGVAHLAALMAKKIARRQPELNITRADIDCVTIAGLCHDIGHGPYSHLFEEVINRIRREHGVREQWHHEKMSCQLLRSALSKIDLTGYNLNEEDVRFVLLMIDGISGGMPWPGDVGRPPEKRFLCDIVCNKRNGIDVDKLDYFLRDSLCCYGRQTVDCHIPRLLSSCRVICFQGEMQICFEEKMAMSLGDIFSLRAKLHKYAYQHRLTKVVDYMISDALMLAEPFFTVRGAGANAPNMRISECAEMVEGFIQLGDWIIDAIAASPDERLKPSQGVIQRIRDRDLYTLVSIAMFQRPNDPSNEHIIREEILGFVDGIENRDKAAANLITSFVKITYGSYDSSGMPDDPLNHVCFYNPKSNPNAAFHLPVARQSPLFSPVLFGEKTLLVVSRRQEAARIIADAFAKWKQVHLRNLSTPVPTVNSPSGLDTPMRKRFRNVGAT